MTMNKLFKKVLKKLIKYRIVCIDFDSEEKADKFFKDLN